MELKPRRLSRGYATSMAGTQPSGLEC